jgi:hypothetical protein
MARRAGIHEVLENEGIELALTRSEVLAARGLGPSPADPSPGPRPPELIEAEVDTTTSIESH